MVRIEESAWMGDRLLRRVQQHATLPLLLRPLPRYGDLVPPSLPAAAHLASAQETVMAPLRPLHSKSITDPAPGTVSPTAVAGNPAQRSHFHESETVPIASASTTATLADPMPQTLLDGEAAEVGATNQATPFPVQDSVVQGMRELNSPTKPAAKLSPLPTLRRPSPAPQQQGESTPLSIPAPVTSASEADSIVQPLPEPGSQIAVARAEALLPAEPAAPDGDQKIDDATWQRLQTIVRRHAQEEDRTTKADPTLDKIPTQISGAAGEARPTSQQASPTESEASVTSTNPPVVNEVDRQPEIGQASMPDSLSEKKQTSTAVSEHLSSPVQALQVNDEEQEPLALQTMPDNETRSYNTQPAQRNQNVPPSNLTRSANARLEPAAEGRSEPKQPIQADESVTKPLPLQAVWPVTRTDKRPSPAKSEAAVPELPPLIHPMRHDRAADAPIHRILQQVPGGRETDSEIELVLPRRSRPTLTPNSEEVRIPETVAETAVSATPANVIQKQPTAAKSDARMVTTDIGSLPEDLWQLLDQEPPASSEVQGTNEPKVARIESVVQTAVADEVPKPPQMLSKRANKQLPTDGNSMEPAMEDLDLDELSQQVYSEIRSRLVSEWERTRGFG